MSKFVKNNNFEKKKLRENFFSQFFLDFIWRFLQTFKRFLFALKSKQCPLYSSISITINSLHLPMCLFFWKKRASPQISVTFSSGEGCGVCWYFWRSLRDFMRNLSWKLLKGVNFNFFVTFFSTVIVTCWELQSKKMIMQKKTKPRLSFRE